MIKRLVGNAFQPAPLAADRHDLIESTDGSQLASWLKASVVDVALTRRLRLAQRQLISSVSASGHVLAGERWIERGSWRIAGVGMVGYQVRRGAFEGDAVAVHGPVR